MRWMAAFRRVELITAPNTQANTLSYAGSDAGVTVNLATASASGGHAEGDEIETYELTLNDGDGR